MINSQTNYTQRRSGSTGLALLFLVIAILGIVLMMNRTPQRPSLAAPDSSFVTSYDTDAPRNFGYYIVRTITITGMIIIVLLLAMKYYKKRHAIDTAGRYHFEILGKRYLSPKQYLVVVRIEESQLLLGVTDHSINLLKEFPQTEDDEQFDKSTPMSATRSFIKINNQETDADHDQESKDQ